MTAAPFAIGRLPRIEFGAGRFARVPDLVASRGRKVLVVTGARSFRASDRWGWLVDELARRGVEHEALEVRGEPSPEVVDGAVRRVAPSHVDVVLGIGGGSVLDAAKAVAGLLRTGRSILDHLEEVGHGVPYEGPSVPFIAVPTTAGTGSEVTKNAVVSVPGQFKRSFRDELLVATDAVVDPDLLIGLSADDIAANGMDALAQLLEAYVTSRANPITDALALAGLAAAREGLLAWHGAVGDDQPPAETADARASMAFAALASGICLAHAGLGVVHGLAAPLGALFPIRHGVACGAVLVAGVEASIAALSAREPESVALHRYAELGRLLSGLPADVPPAAARDNLLPTLRAWRERLAVPGLGSAGLTPASVAAVVAGSRGGSMRGNPIVLTDDELADVLLRSL